MQSFLAAPLGSGFWFHAPEFRCLSSAHVTHADHSPPDGGIVFIFGGGWRFVKSFFRYMLTMNGLLHMRWPSSVADAIDCLDLEKNAVYGEKDDIIPISNT